MSQQVKRSPLSVRRGVPWIHEAAAHRRPDRVDVRQGRYDIHADPHDRWHVRLLQDERVDVWLISWTTDQGTQMHDHGGSAGAFTVVSGELSEVVWDVVTGRPTERGVRAGDSVS